MTRPSAVALDMRLMVGASLAPRLKAMDDAQYAAFEAAVVFAQAEIGRVLAVADLPRFVIAHGELLLTVSFCRQKERFVVVDLEETDGDPPEGGQPSAHLRGTLAESLLRVAGVRSEALLDLQPLRPEQAAVFASASIRMDFQALNLRAAGSATFKHRPADGALFLATSTLRDPCVSGAEAFGVRVGQGSLKTSEVVQVPSSGAQNSTSTDR